MQPSWWAAHPLLVGAGAATLLAAVAYRRRSLTTAGSCAAWPVGATAAASGPVPFAALVAFFFTATAVTRLGARRKRSVEGAAYKAHGGRSVANVLCNGGPATALCLAAWAAAGTPGVIRAETAGGGGGVDGRAVLLAVVAQFAAAQGDTWSSEIGVLSAAPPRLLLGLRRVPAGTNGAVSPLGLAAAPLGAAVVGAAAAAAAAACPGGGETPLSPVTVLATAVAAGLGGSLLDSLLGQFLQSSYAVPATPGPGAPLGPTAGLADAAVTVQSEDQPGARHISGWALLSNDGVNAVTNLAVTVAAYLYFRR